MICPPRGSDDWARRRDSISHYACVSCRKSVILRCLPGETCCTLSPMKTILLVVFAFLLTTMTTAQTAPDPQLLAEISKIKAVDNHTHVPKVVGPGEKDDDYDALPCGGFLEPNDDPAMARPDNPLFLEAWQKLYGYKYNDKVPEHVRELLAAKQRVAQEQGDNFPTWVLDQLGTEYMLANRVSM